MTDVGGKREVYLGFGKKTVQDEWVALGFFFFLKSMVALVLAENIPNRQTPPSLVSESFHQHPAYLKWTGN